MLKEILESLGISKDPTKLTDEEWAKVSEAVLKEQKRRFDEGKRLGMRGNLTPEEQAREDKRNPNLKDPTRGGSERKG